MITFLYFIAMMLPIVIIHELGHYWIGRLSGIKPEVFSVGFGPELIQRTDKHGTKWRLAAFPLGGFVKFAPDAKGTGFPNVETDKPPYLAPFWGKIATVFAGPVANFIMSFVIFFIVATLHGLPSEEPVIASIDPNVQTNIEVGDRISAVNSEPIETIWQLYELSEPLGDVVPVTVERGGEFVNLETPNPNVLIAGAVIPGEPAELAGVEPGDIIESIDGEKATNTQMVVDRVKEGESVEFGLRRGDENLDIVVTPKMKDDGVYRVGIYFGSPFGTEAQRMGVGDAALYGFRQTNWILIMSFEGLRDLVTGEVSIRAMSGPVGMARFADQAASGGFWDFILFMGFVSSAIGFMNLLPIPILDGGHIVLMTYERIFGKLPPQIVINFLFMLGIALLLGVLMVTTFNEIFTQ